MIIKKISYFLFAAIILLLSSGVLLVYHHCNQNNEDFSSYYIDKGCEHESSDMCCNSESKEKDDCCAEKNHQTVKINKASCCSTTAQFIKIGTFTYKKNQKVISPTLLILHFLDKNFIVGQSFFTYFIESSSSPPYSNRVLLDKICTLLI
jgi:hypothetical protein